MMEIPGKLIINPILPPALLVLLVGGFVVLSWYSLRRCELTVGQRVGLWLLRAVAVLILAVLVLQPVLRYTSEKNRAPTLAVGVDVSASMTDRPDETQPSRAQRAEKVLNSGLVRRLKKRYQVVTYALGAETRRLDKKPGDLDFDDPSTHLTAGMNRIAGDLRGENVAGVVLLSDGLDQSTSTLDTRARNRPVFPVELETPFEAAEEKGEEVRIADISHPQFAVQGWTIKAQVMIRRRGAASMRVPVRLSEEGNVLRTRNVSFGKGRRFRQLQFSFKPQTKGRHVYRVTIDPPRDTDEKNNRREFIVEVTEKGNRALYLEAEPRWGFKFLKRSIMAEKEFRLEAFVSGGGDQFYRFAENGGGRLGRAGLPAFTPENLLKYKVVILGDLGQSHLQGTDWGAVESFVKDGGGLLLYGGRDALKPGGFQSLAPLRKLMPARSRPESRMVEGEFRVMASPAGRNHEVLEGLVDDGNFPPLLSCWVPVKVHDLSTVLLQQPGGDPVLVVRPYGEGRVGLVLSNTLWRWQLGAGVREDASTAYHRLISQLLHWLAPTERRVGVAERLQLLTSDLEVPVGKNVRIGALLQGGRIDPELDLACKVQTPAGEKRELPMSPGKVDDTFGLEKTHEGFTCSYSPDSPGTYIFEVRLPDRTRRAEARILAKEPRQEKTGKPVNRKYLEQLAERTGGSFVKWDKRKQLRQALPYEPTRIKNVSEESVWDHPAWLIILIAVMCFEWWWRRRLDML